jgi:hypothetical protein
MTQTMYAHTNKINLKKKDIPLDKFKKQYNRGSQDNKDTKVHKESSEWWSTVS